MARVPVEKERYIELLNEELKKQQGFREGMEFLAIVSPGGEITGLQMHNAFWMPVVFAHAHYIVAQKYVTM